MDKLGEGMEKLGGEDVGQQVSPGRVALASSIGATIEWYDFFIYGTAAGLEAAPIGWKLLIVGSAQSI